MVPTDLILDLIIRYAFQVIGAVVLFAGVVSLDRFGFQLASLVAGIGVAGLGGGPGLPQREVRIIDGGAVAAAR